MRTILLIDMDAFFASVEQQCNPQLRGKPIAVIGSQKRAVITTSSYEARAFGVKTGMNIYEAKKLCPHLILVVGNNAKYTYACKVLSELYQRYTPLVEVYSIDEAFLDITDTAHLFGEPLEIGEAIKKAIQSRFGIHATIGVSYNKLMAKLASDISKPNGLRWIKSEEAPKLLESLPPGELCGIGKRTAERLDQMGIKTCGDLGRASASLLRNRFGVIGLRLKAMGLGIDHSPVSPEMEETKSVGHSMTLPRDVFHMDDVAAYLLRLSEMVGSRARRYRLLGSVVTVVVRYKNFETFSKQKKIKTFTNDTHVIYATAMKIIHAMKLRQAVRLLGVSLSSIIKDHGQMYVIGELEKRNKLLQTIDHINRRFGDSTVSWAMYASLDKDAGVISPAWRPSGVHRTNV